jgi:hypothetical protein
MIGVVQPTHGHVEGMKAEPVEHFGNTAQKSLIVGRQDKEHPAGLHDSKDLLQVRPRILQVFDQIVHRHNIKTSVWESELCQELPVYGASKPLVCLSGQGRTNLGARNLETTGPSATQQDSISTANIQQTRLLYATLQQYLAASQVAIQVSFHLFVDTRKILALPAAPIVGIKVANRIRAMDYIQVYMSTFFAPVNPTLLDLKEEARVWRATGPAIFHDVTRNLFGYSQGSGVWGPSSRVRCRAH